MRACAATCCKAPDSRYARGAGLDESVPFISSAWPGVEEQRTHLPGIGSPRIGDAQIEFVALRYGFFCGPGTWSTRKGDIGDQVRQQQVPIIGEGQGVYSFVHIDDAAGATAAALECPPGPYNIVDGNPSHQHLWLTAFARAAGAPAPPRVSEEEALRARQAPTRSTTRRRLGALRTRKPGVSLSSVRARPSGFRSKSGLMSVGIDQRMYLAGQLAAPRIAPRCLQQCPLPSRCPCSAAFS